MTNEQIAHDLAIARNAGKQFPAEILVKDYKTAYEEILNYLNSEQTE